MTSSPVQPHPTGVDRLWRNCDYRFWLGADTGQLLGLSLYAFVTPLIALMVLDDPAAAGTIAAAGQAARVLATLPGGVIADRYDRRRLMVLAGILGALIVLIFLLLTTAVLGQSTDRVEFWALMAVSMVMGARNGLLGAVSNTALKNIVKPAQLPTALSANQARDGAIQIGAAPLGGLLLAIGPAVALATQAVAFVASALSALGIRGNLHPRRGSDADPQPDAVAVEATSMLSEAKEGLAWLFRQPPLRGVLGVSVTINLGVNGAITTLIFAFQQDGLSPAAIGLLSSALGVAMVAGALLAPALVQRFRSGRLAIAGLVPAVLAIALLPLVDGVWATAVVLGVGFLGVPATNAALLGYAMAIIPQQMMGRVMTGFDLFAMGAVPLAPVIAGFGLAWAGRGPTLILCAGFCLVALGLAMGSRSLRRLPRPDQWETGQ